MLPMAADSAGSSLTRGAAGLNRRSMAQPPDHFADREIGITAAEMGRMAEVSARDVHYWAKLGYIKRRLTASSPYLLTELPKAYLMGIFANKLHMDAASAFRMAEQLLPLYAERPDAAVAIEKLAAAVDRHIDRLADLLLGSELIDEIDELACSDSEEDDNP